MAFLDLLWVGLLSGVPVGLIIGLVVTLRAGTSPILKQLKLPWGKGKSLAFYWGGSLFLAIIAGVIGAWVYGYVSSTWGWDATAFLLLGLGLAAILSVLAFLPLYQGKRMTGAVDVSILNFIVGVGFGVLVPYFTR